MPDYPQLPQEYTPELTEAFYERMARPIRERKKRAIGEARGEALSRGMVGDPLEALGVGSAKAAETSALSDLYADIGWQAAGMQREERLIGERRTYQTGERVAGQEFMTGERMGGQEFRTGERMGGQEFMTGERMGGQEFRTGERVAGQEFTSAEAAKLQAFQERMAQLDYDRKRDLEALETRRDYQSKWGTYI